MHPRLRFWLVVALGALAGVVVSFGLAEEAYVLATLTVTLIGWLLLEWFGGPRPEAWLLAAVLGGYVVASRGFAQLLLSPQLPLLPGESALAAGLAAAILRMAFRQTAVVRRDLLNAAILGWIVLGAARLWPDFGAYGVVALRDFATVYYALFFFLAQSLATHPPSARLLRNTLLASFAILPFSYFIFTHYGDILQPIMQFRGVPLVYYKEDLAAANFFAGFFLLLTVPDWPMWARNALALASYASAFAISSSRAAIVGLLVTSTWWAVARRWTPWKLQGLAAPVAIGVLAVLAVVQPGEFRESRLYTLYEHGASMVDLTGTGHYSTEDRRYVGDNNRFRLVWWRSVIEETLRGGPIFGLGFGADLSSRFLRTYELDLGEEFATRSPHSIIFTVLGRMGLAGLAVFLCIIGGMALRTLRLARVARSDDRVLVPLGWWSVSWVMLSSACFGVVMEGPMGAVLFWTALGMANATGADALAAHRETSSATSAVEPSAETASLRNTGAVPEVSHSS
ncbi:MAG: O-antigen ligase family protein [Verrucomicrobia bacterium]|nr:O-antigen ligase family protein [Verrucomicrobiota bacterium]